MATDSIQIASRPLRGHPGTPIIRVGILFVYCVAFVLLPSQVGDPGVTALLPSLLALSFVQLAPLLVSADPDVFEPPVYSGIYAALATWATIALFIVRDRIDMPLVRGVDPEGMTTLAHKVVWALLLGRLCYYAGYYHPQWGRVVARSIPSRARPGWNTARLRLAAAGCGVVFVLCYAEFHRRAGGPLFDVTRLSEGKAVWREDPRLSWMIRGVSLGFIPLFLYGAHLASVRSRGRLVLVCAATLVMAALVVRLGQRGPSALAVLILVIVIHYLRWRIPALLLVLALYLGITAGNSLLRYRETYLQPDQDEAGVLVAPLNPTTVLAAHELERQRFAAHAAIFHAFPEQQQYLLGRSWLAIGAMPIPRWIWPEKVELFQWRDTRILYRLTGAPIPSSFLATLYANFSWLGIVLGMALLGTLHRALYLWLQARQGDPATVLLYASLLLVGGFTLLELSAMLQFVLPIWLVTRFIAVDLRGHGAPLESRAA